MMLLKQVDDGPEVKVEADYQTPIWTLFSHPETTVVTVQDNKGQVFRFRRVAP